MDMQFDAVVLADGECPSHPVPMAVLRQATHVVACDGAIIHVPLAEIVVGDGDSVPVQYRERLVQVDEQEDNDLTKATRYCLSRGGRRLAYLRATGLREDHTLGNISLLMRYYCEMDIDGVMYTNYGFFTPDKGDRTFPSVAGRQVSIFNFGCTAIASEGLKWNSYAYQEWWQGTLNESLSDSFTLHADGYYLVYQTYEKKK